MRKKFTLIEIVIAILVVGILAAIVLINISNVREKAIVSMLNSNIKNIQTAVDLYYLENNETYPTKKEPTLYEPQFIDFDKLVTKYLKEGPDYSKLKNQYYQVDYTGKVWGSTVKSVDNYYKSSKYIEWYSSEEISSHNYYSVLSQNNNSKNSKKVRVRLLSAINKTGAERIKMPNQNQDFLLSSLDKYGFETAPAGLGFSQDDWFDSLIQKEGTFTFEFSGRDTMYWDNFWTLEYKPEGTDIQYRFSTIKENGEWSEWNEDFYSLNESKSIKVEVKMIGNNEVYPSLIDMKIDYHFKGEVVWYFDLSSKPKKAYPEEIQEHILNENIPVYEVSVPKGEYVREFNIPKGILKDSIKIVDAEGEEVKELSELKDGTTYYFIGEKQNGIQKNPNIRDIVNYSEENLHSIGTETVSIVTSPKEIPTFIFKPNEPSLEQIKHIKDNEKIKDIEWTTIDAFNLFFNADSYEEVKWKSAIIYDLQPENTRILYFYTPSVDNGWGSNYEDLSSAPNSRALRVSVVLQVKSKFIGIADNPEFYSMEINHEGGGLMPSPYNEYVMIYPKKLNDLNLKGYFTSTVINWNYVIHSNNEITDIEWKGNKENYDTAGEYPVGFRYKNAKGDWSQWYSQVIEIKDVGLKPNKTVVPNGWVGISTVEEFMKIGNDVNYSNKGKYILLNSLDFSMIQNHSPKSFEGEFDGNGLSIDNLKIVYNSKDGGLFSKGINTYVHDLYIRNAEVKGTNNVGVLFGELSGNSKIERVGVVNSKVEGANGVGGIVGSSNFTKDSIGGVTNSFVHQTEIKGSYNVGGLIGLIPLGYSTAKNLKVENNYVLEVNITSPSKPSYNSYFGGIIGDVIGSPVVDYNYSIVNLPQGSSDGLSIDPLHANYTTNIKSYFHKERQLPIRMRNAKWGRTEIQMKQQSNYSTWDFNTIWKIEEGISYPYLQWQVPLEDLIIR